jgi:pilus assembly protein Flp/PilA
VARILSRARTFVVRDDAATMVEYALMVALIALVCFTAVAFLGTSTSAAFSNPTLLNAL